MSLFVKHVADKQHFPVFLRRYGTHCQAWSLYGVFPGNLGQGILVANSLGPRDPKRISRAEQCGLRTRQRQTVVLYSPSLSLKALDIGILLLAVFSLELEMDYPSETSLCTVTPSPKTPLLQFFWLYTCHLERIIPSSNCPS